MDARNWRRTLARGALLSLAVLAIAAFLVVPACVEESMNPVPAPARPITVSAAAANLHRQLVIVDLHADSLLWGRDLLARGTRGHVDVPRLIAGNVALQNFTLVTQSPRGLNYERNAGDSDEITPLVILQRYPPRAWTRRAERALEQARRLQAFAADSGGRLTLITSAADLRGYLARRAEEPGITAGLLGIEGAHALDGDLANVDRFFAAGIRTMAPSHFFDNDIGGSVHGVDKTGLTEKGRAMVRRMNELAMIIDVAHASARTLDEVLALSTRPVIVSHTGVKGTCDNNRNLSDDQLRALAAGGALIGIGFWDTATCGMDASFIARAMRHAVDVAGIDHVALGSDYDGAVAVPFDTADMAHLTQALLQQGFSDVEITAVMGGNAIRFLLANLP